MWKCSNKECNKILKGFSFGVGQNKFCDVDCYHKAEELGLDEMLKKQTREFKNNESNTPVKYSFTKIIEKFEMYPDEITILKDEGKNKYQVHIKVGSEVNFSHTDDIALYNGSIKRLMENIYDDLSSARLAILKNREYILNI